MDKFQIVRDKANERGGTFLVSHDTELMTSTLYGPLKILFNNKMAEIGAAKQKQFEQTGYITGDKEYHRNLAGSTVWKYSNRGSSQAFITNHPDLSAALDKHLSYILKGKDGDVYGTAYDLYQLMKDYDSILTSIEAADFTEMETVLADYKKVLNAPKEEIKGKKAEGTDPIPGLLDELDVIKSHIGKVIQSYFAHLYSQWEEIIKVGSPIGVRKLMFVVLFKEAETGVILRNVRAKLVKGAGSFVKMSSKKGYVRFYSLDPGNYALTTEYPYYNSYSKSGIGLDMNHIEKLEVSLTLGDQEMRAMVVNGNLNVTVYDKVSGEPQVGATVDLPALSHSFTTGEDGQDLLEDVALGKYQGSVSCPGYKTLDFSVNIKAGKTSDLKLYLEKEA